MATPEQLHEKTHRLDEDEAAATAFSVAERRLQLVVVSGPGEGRAINLAQEIGATTQIGKADDNDLALAHPSVSRYHCTIERDATGLLLKDAGSTNGTFVDEARVKEIYLRPGATVRVGAVKLRLVTDWSPLSIKPSARRQFGALLGSNDRMREIFGLLERIADSDATVLITGETGTGKGAIARALHEQSKRRGEPFMVVDCGSVAPTLIESELFGHEKGAFTGADQRRLGALEQAANGTLFLDELDDLRKDLQPKLLRALEDRSFNRVGSAQPLRFAARVVVASKKNLRALVAQGALREDLYFRLAVFRIDLPPLREHREDLPLLVERFARGFGHDGFTWQELPADVRQRLEEHHWPGNVRELRNTVERALTLRAAGALGAEGWEVEPDPLGHSTGPFDRAFLLPLKEAKDSLLAGFEREYLARLLRRCGGNVSRCAREAQINRRHLYTLLEKYGLARGAAPGDENEE